MGVPTGLTKRRWHSRAGQKAGSVMQTCPRVGEGGPPSWSGGLGHGSSAGTRFPQGKEARRTPGEVAQLDVLVLRASRGGEYRGWEL